MKHMMGGQGWRKTIDVLARPVDVSGATAQGQEREEGPGAGRVTGGDVADHGIGIEVTEEADPERGKEGGREDINN